LQAGGGANTAAERIRVETRLDRWASPLARWVRWAGKPLRLSVVCFKLQDVRVAWGRPGAAVQRTAGTSTSSTRTTQNSAFSAVAPVVSGVEPNSPSEDRLREPRHPPGLARIVLQRKGNTVPGPSLAGASPAVTGL